MRASFVLFALALSNIVSGRTCYCCTNPSHYLIIDDVGHGSSIGRAGQSNMDMQVQETFDAEDRVMELGDQPRPLS